MARALIFSLNYYPFVGGAEVAIKEITDRIPDIDFHLIAYRFDANLPKREKVGNVTVHRIGVGKRGMTVEESFKPTVYLGKVLYVPLAAFKAFSLHRERHFDLFWAMMCYMTFPITLLQFLGVRVPYVLTLQEGDPFERVFERRRIRLFAPLLTRGIRHATAVQAISTFLLAWARKAGFSGYGEMIPNGVDTGRFTHTARTPKEGGAITLVTTSRLVGKNGIDTVVRALPLLPEHVSFAIYGRGPDEGKLKALAHELKAENRTRFMGQVGHDALPAALTDSDIFIRPSRSEGMGNSFIEAMAAGLPVIATQEGGIADFLFDAKRNPEKETTGWAVDTDAPEQIADAVKDILARPEQVAKVTKTARELVVAKYDWSTVAADMRSLFLKVAN